VLDHGLSDPEAREPEKEIRRDGRGSVRVNSLHRLDLGHRLGRGGLQTDTGNPGLDFGCLLQPAAVQLFLFDASGVGSIVLGTAAAGLLSSVQLAASERAVEVLTAGIGGHGEEFDVATATADTASAQLVAIPQRRLQRGAIGLNSELGAVELPPIW
jgi:hypothetical protein